MKLDIAHKYPKRLNLSRFLFMVTNVVTHMLIPSMIQQTHDAPGGIFFGLDRGNVHLEHLGVCRQPKPLGYFGLSLRLELVTCASHDDDLGALKRR